MELDCWRCERVTDQAPLEPDGDGVLAECLECGAENEIPDDLDMRAVLGVPVREYDKSMRWRDVHSVEPL